MLFLSDRLPSETEPLGQNFALEILRSTRPHSSSNYLLYCDVET